MYRLQVQHVHDDPDTGQPVYNRELPDSAAVCWSSVAHRVGWQPAAANANFRRTFECPRRPTRYFIVETDLTAPFEYDWDNGNYPLSRGVLSDDVVHASTATCGRRSRPPTTTYRRAT